MWALRLVSCLLLLQHTGEVFGLLAIETLMNYRRRRLAPSPVQPFRGQGVLRISRSPNSFINAKKAIKIGNWNVRTLNRDGKIDELIKVFQDYEIDVCALTETRLTGIDNMVLDDGLRLLLSGRRDGMHYQGVGLLLGSKANKALCEWDPMDERLLYARFKSTHGNISMIVCYAPTNDAPDERKDEFYVKLQEGISRVAKHDVLVCIGDFNAIMGKSNEGFEECMGNMGLGRAMNENGVRLGSFCLANNLVVGGTLFQHLDIHKTTWVSPCGKYKNQIDHIAVSKKYRSSLLDVQVKRGADIGSDHQLCISKFRIKLKSWKEKNSVARKYDIDLIRREGEERDEFKAECRNRFLVLDTLDEGESNVNEMSGNMNEVLHDAAGRTIRRRRRMRRKKWISEETWDVIRKRAKAKLKSEMSSPNSQEFELARAEYWSLDSEVKRLSRRDKRRYVDKKAYETETLINKNDGHSQRLAYEAISELNGCFGKNKEIPVRDENGNLLTKSADIRNRWREHFEKVLNRPIPPDDDIPPAQEDLDIDIGGIRLDEVIKAIKHLKNYKAPGEDGLFPEMFKVEEDGLVYYLRRLFNEIWVTGIVPSSWKNGVIVKVPKKGDLSQCGNWRGITLSPIALKIFSIILLNRLEPVVDSILRDEQAGFRKGRGCNDQIFIVRHLVQQANEMQFPVSLCFVDFEKAFDSISRRTMGKILRHYGIPEEFVRVILNMHDGNSCKVMVDGSLSDPFEVKSGVLQGGILSPLLFVLVIDYIMKKVKGETDAGILWSEGRKLLDLDYADDIVFICNRTEEMQRVLDCLVNEGKKVGLVINSRKTEIMNINIENAHDCFVEGTTINQVDKFKYLGTIVAKDGSLGFEYEERRRRAHQAMGMLKNIWLNSNFSIHTKINIYKVMVRSILIYGHESWYSTVTTDRKLLAFENKALRRILGIKWWERVSNSRIREITGLQPVDEFVRFSRWKWLGHVYRRHGLVRDAPGWVAPGRRGRGRPRETWLRTMRREVGDDSWEDIEELAQDRLWWRMFIKALCIPEGATGND